MHAIGLAVWIIIMVQLYEGVLQRFVATCLSQCELWAPQPHVDVCGWGDAQGSCSGALLRAAPSFCPTLLCLDLHKNIRIALCGIARAACCLLPKEM